MRARLSELLVESAIEDTKFVVLSGDHGYALFDRLRKERPKQFINCGVAEQNMVGVAAGLAREGFRPLVYGLASFIPMRVLEQIKLDVCYSKLPVTFIGDGAGLVYSHLGASHQCAEDVAALMPMPHMRIYSPADWRQLVGCYLEATERNMPSYIRIGKADRPMLSSDVTMRSTTAIIATGSMASLGEKLAEEFNLSFVAVSRIKPLQEIPPFDKLIVIEEHSRHGGLYSAIVPNHWNTHPICLKDKFTEKCGDYQYALSEHGMSDEQIRERVMALVTD